MEMCLRAGSECWDVDAVRQAMPDKLFRRWEEFNRLEPQGTGRLYAFLSHAFCRLARSFHSPEVAYELRPWDFQWWVPQRELTEAEEAELDLSDDEIERHADHVKALRESGVV